MRRTLVALLAVAACHGTAIVHRPGEDWLQTIDIQGNKAIPTDDLLDGIALSRVRDQGGAIDPYQLTVDTDRIRAAFLKLGFFEVDVQTKVDVAQNVQTIHFLIKEGKRATTKVVISGLPDDVALEDARKLIKLDEGEPFDYDAYDDAKDELVAMLENEGYAHAALDAQVIADHVHAEATIQLLFDAGPKCKFGPIEIVGVDPTLEEAVRARLKFEPGETFSQTALSKTQTALYELARFSTVRIEPDKTGSDVIPVKIGLARASRNELKLGGGLAYEPLTNDIRARAAYSIVDPWPLFNLGIESQLAITFPRSGPLVPDFSQPEPKGHISATLSRIDLFSVGVKGEVVAGYDYVTIEAFTNYGPRLQLGLSSKLWLPWLHGRIGWLFADYGFRDFHIAEAAETALGLDIKHPNERIGAFQGALSADLRDDPIAATRGVYFEVRASQGTPYAGSAYTYTRIVPEFRAFYPVLGNVLAARVRFGGIFGSVPATERFFGGGASSQRGFSERFLSPAVIGTGSMDGEQVPVGGAGIIETNFEVRRFFGKKFGLRWGGVAFLDGGDVTNTPEELDPTNLHWAVGGGIRIEIIKSLSVRLDLGYRLNRHGPAEPEPDSRWAFHLGVGEAY